MKLSKLVTIFLLAITLPSHVIASDLDKEILSLQQAWAKINYQLPKDEKESAFEALVKTAHAVSEQYAGQAEPLIWEAIILSTYAGEQGGLGALSKIKKARNLLLEAEKIDAKALDGSVYTTLGSLHYKAPGWPISFGSNKKAESYLRKALAINPNGIDPNYFYADFLLEQEAYAEAIKGFEKALQAPARVNRPLADSGRREEIKLKLAIARAELEKH